MQDYFVSIVPAYEILMTYNELSERINNDGAIINDAFRALQNTAGRLSEEDNPVLILYKLK